MKKLILLIGIVLLISGCDKKYCLTYGNPPCCEYGYDSNEDRCMTQEEINNLEIMKDEVLKSRYRIRGCESGCYEFYNKTLVDVNNITKSNDILFDCYRNC